jgi:hypothetical protein
MVRLTQLSWRAECDTMPATHMEQRRIISVIFLVTVIVMALLLFAQYNKVPLSTVPVLRSRAAST